MQSRVRSRRRLYRSKYHCEHAKSVHRPRRRGSFLPTLASFYRAIRTRLLGGYLCVWECTIFQPPICNSMLACYMYNVFAAYKCVISFLCSVYPLCTILVTETEPAAVHGHFWRLGSTGSWTGHTSCHSSGTLPIRPRCNQSL